MEELRSLADPSYLELLGRLNVDPGRSIGVRMPEVRALARRIGPDRGLAAELWATGVTEAMVLASLVEVPSEMGEGQMEEWVLDIRDWVVCDQVVSNLFSRTGHAHRKAGEWTSREEEFVKRAGLALMASLASRDREEGDEAFLDLLHLAEDQADDPRRYVMGAVSWAVRQIGKRDRSLNRAAVEAAERISRRGTSPARRIASEALRELRSERVQGRLRGPGG